MEDINKGLSKKQSIISLYLNDYKEATYCILGTLLAILLVAGALIESQNNFVITLASIFMWSFFVLAVLVMALFPTFAVTTLRHYMKCHCKIEQYYAENEDLDLDSMLNYIKKISEEKCSYFGIFKLHIVASSLYWGPISDFLILQYGVFFTEDALENLGGKND